MNIHTIKEKLAILTGHVSGKYQKAQETVCDGIECYKNRYRPKEAEYLSGIDAVLHAPLPTIAWLLPASIMAFFLVFMVWACFSEVEIISPSMGKTVPSSRVQLIQAPELCIIREVLVREGQSVKAGQPLIVFDQTEAEGDVRDLENQLNKLKAQHARLAALADSDDDLMLPYVAPEGVPARLIETEKRIMEAQFESHCADMATLDQGIAQKEAELKEVQAELDKATAMLRFSRQRMERLEQLFADDAVSKSGLEEVEEEWEDRRKSLDVLTQSLRRIEAELGYAIEQRRSSAEQYRHTILTELGDCEQQLVTTEQQFKSAQRRMDLQTLEAPIDGTVLDLAVHTKEGVVEAAAQLMRIVPEDSPLEVEAKILNRDIGFVQPGQHVEVKFDTFEFTKYGSIPGTISKIAHDVILDEQYGPVYRCLIEMERDTINVGAKKVKLIPGMSCQVDVNVGDRRLIEYILTPILRYKSEALRER
ncbi:HlyD family type I secretion periplasmic adaptor subunit [Salidesulfovibrio onnuriiensis]|uniref:HlyD family type I secretion periplasmic adaptor subunit n=1 Tax=Salidesulfovibrio onnuriiensis TaxID=2583823 RepID=UPI0011CAEF1B|nr:HlyD family type I secretion periplasmic adaptor subunit [Salidesulfovibrio onnuriiensis]